jgi:HNH endonuclease
MARVGEIWERDGGRCVWCGARPWDRDRTIEHLLPRSRAGTSSSCNLLPACRPCNRARRSRSAAAYARQRAADGADVQAELLLLGLDRLREHGMAAERRYGARQGGAVRDWLAGEEALAAHAQRLA